MAATSVRKDLLSDVAGIRVGLRQTDSQTDSLQLLLHAIDHLGSPGPLRGGLAIDVPALALHARAHPGASPDSTSSCGSDPTKQRVIGEGLSFAIDARSDLPVVKGTRRAKLTYATGIRSVAVDAAKRKVVVDVDDFSCIGNTKHTWTFNHLEARLENWAAYGLA